MSSNLFFHLCQIFRYVFHHNVLRMGSLNLYLMELLIRHLFILCHCHLNNLCIMPRFQFSKLFPWHTFKIRYFIVMKFYIRELG